MNGLLAEFGKKIADRWLTTQLFPGLLFTAAALCAYLLGWRHAVDSTELTTGLDWFGKALAARLTLPASSWPLSPQAWPPPAQVWPPMLWPPWCTGPTSPQAHGGG